MWSGTWDGWDVFWTTVMMIAFWGGLVWLIAYAVRRTSEPGQRVPAEPSALEVLEERFARGEIDRDEFEERHRILTSSAA